MRKLLAILAAPLVVLMGLVAMSAPAQAEPHDDVTWTKTCETVTFHNGHTEEVRIIAMEGGEPGSSMLFDDFTFQPGEDYTVPLVNGYIVVNIVIDGGGMTFDIFADTDCGLGHEGTISWTAGCGTVTFTNNGKHSVWVDYGSFAEDDPDDSFRLGAGETWTVETVRTQLDFQITGVGDYFETGSVAVEQDCETSGGDDGGETNGDTAEDPVTGDDTKSDTTTKDVPKVAPKAGVSGGSSALPNAGALVALTALGVVFATRKALSQL